MQQGGENLNERLRLLRDELNLTQETFGERIGSARNTIANYENGNRNPSNAVIKSICREFNVNEEWLRGGIGEMFIQLPLDQDTLYLSELLMGYEDNPFYDLVKEMMHTYVNLDSKSQKLISETTKKLLDNLKKREG